MRGQTIDHSHVTPQRHLRALKLVDDDHAYRGSLFQDVWRVIASDPYRVLPRERVDVRSIAAWLKGAALLRASRRTLDRRADLLPPFSKLIHPFGICLRGRWKITHDTPYTGYFGSGKEALIIARASDALNETRPFALRFLGLAGKLFPTVDEHHARPLETANFFAFDNLAGAHRERFTSAALANDLLHIKPHLAATRYLPLVSVAGPALALADHALNPTRAMIRQLYPIAELGERQPARAYGPRFMRLVNVFTGPSLCSFDLREELDMRHHADGLRYEIQVADGSRLLRSAWRTIGEIHFTHSVASRSGDTRLHFAHPRYYAGRAERAPTDRPSPAGRPPGR